MPGWAPRAEQTGVKGWLANQQLQPYACAQPAHLHHVVNFLLGHRSIVDCIRVVLRRIARGTRCRAAAQASWPSFARAVRVRCTAPTCGRCTSFLAMSPCTCTGLPYIRMSACVQSNANLTIDCDGLGRELRARAGMVNQQAHGGERHDWSRAAGRACRW